MIKEILIIFSNIHLTNFHIKDIIIILKIKVNRLNNLNHLLSHNNNRMVIIILIIPREDIQFHLRIRLTKDFLLIIHKIFIPINNQATIVAIQNDFIENNYFSYSFKYIKVKCF